MGKPNRESESAGSATLDEFFPAYLALKKEGLTVGDLAWMRSNFCGINNSTSLVDFIHEQRAMSETNPYALSFGAIMEVFERANAEEGWDITPHDIQRLWDTQPNMETLWPKGDVFPSLRIRFGHGADGVRETFQRHLKRLAHVLGESWWKPEGDLPSVSLRNGNKSHKPVVEWVLIDASAGNSLRRSNDCLPENYGGPNSVADEGLVLAWLYPDRLLKKEPFRAMVFEGYLHEDDNTCSLTTMTAGRKVRLLDKHSYSYIHTRPVILKV